MMKKSILAIAVASLAVSTAAMAESTVYGNVHLSLNQADNDVPDADNNLNVSSNTSAIGVKGSEDLGDGLKAIYQLEWEIDIGLKPDLTPDDNKARGNDSSGAVGALKGRDQFVGLKGGLGTVKFGTMSSNYKQMGGKVDPLYRTPLEGRGFLDIQSPLHGGKGINRGRMTHAAQYVSPKFSGVELVANTTFSGSNDETMGLGVRWSNKNILVYVDWINTQVTTLDDTSILNEAYLTCDSSSTTQPCDMGTAIKVGGKFDADAFSVAVQYEMLDTGEWKSDTDYLFVAGTFNINANNAIIATYGMRDTDEQPGDPSSIDSDGYAIAYNHNMSKMTNVYVGYGAKSNDVAYADGGGDLSMITAGLKKKF